MCEICQTLNRRGVGRRAFLAGAGAAAFAGVAAPSAPAAGNGIPDSAWDVVREGWEASPYGSADQIGAANRLTPAVVQRALTLPRDGRVVSLALPLDETAPAYPPRRFDHYAIVNIGTDGSNTDDFIHASLNTGTQIDGLAHLGVDGVFYNGNRGADFVVMEGLRRLGTEHIPPFVTRGLVLDMVALKGREMEGGEVITVADIEAALGRQGLPTPESGDVVLFHTGWLRHWRADSDLYWREEPGPGIEAARWLAERGVVAVGNDTSRLEADPFERDGLFFPVHQILLAESGVYILENLDTDALVAAGGADRPFLLMIAPLPVVGASQTWINPVAVL